jgi:uncharacterized membrane protein YdjX (TVP38/TMEM64 family)
MVPQQTGLLCRRRGTPLTRPAGTLSRKGRGEFEGNPLMPRPLKITLALAALSTLFYVYHYVLHDPISLANLKAQQAGFADWYAQSPALVVALFFGLYVLVTATSIPAATILTLAAGALFGVVEGTIIVSFASSIGATLAMLASRYLFRDWVTGKFGDKLTSFNEGMAREGAYYLFALRLVPVVPFFVINLLMGLTAIRARTFYWVSQIGMLAATVVYVNAGTQLAKIDSLKGIASPSLIASFVALGLFPVVAKAVVGKLRRA